MLGMFSGELGGKITLPTRREYLFDICYDLICIRTTGLEKVLTSSSWVHLCGIVGVFDHRMKGFLASMLSTFPVSKRFEATVSRMSRLMRRSPRWKHSAALLLNEMINSRRVRRHRGRHLAFDALPQDERGHRRYWRALSRMLHRR